MTRGTQFWERFFGRRRTARTKPRYTPCSCSCDSDREKRENGYSKFTRNGGHVSAVDAEPSFWRCKFGASLRQLSNGIKRIAQEKMQSSFRSRALWLAFESIHI